jgi:hypothetical protein
MMMIMMMKGGTDGGKNQGSRMQTFSNRQVNGES